MWLLVFVASLVLFAFLFLWFKDFQENVQEEFSLDTKCRVKGKMDWEKYPEFQPKKNQASWKQKIPFIIFQTNEEKVLPGMKDAAQPPVIYTFFSDESATMMTILADGLQIHRGTSSVIRAKAERMSREQNDAPVVELIPDRIQKLTPVPWFSLSLFEERSRRVLAGVAVAGALAVAGLSVFVWLIAAMATVSAHADLREIQERTDAKSLQLLNTVQAQRASPMREQIAQFADVNDGLLALSGYLEVYQINDNKAEWRAVVPANVTSDRIRELGGQTLDSNPQGVVIGNVKDLQMNKKKRR